jgi:DNA primase
MADDFAQLVKQQADIVKVIGESVRLRKAGAQNFVGLCPFHKEKSPSFSVHATQQFFHCFGCGQSGDVFTFVMKMENLTFPEAVRAVAQKSGIPLPKREFNSPEEAKQAGQRRQLMDMHEAAAAWFQQQLQSPEAARAREYLSGRGVTPETITQFRIGYAPESFNALRDVLRGKFDFDDTALRASGLFSAKEQADGSLGQLYDRFRKRITFPIANEQGRVIAFTARALDSGDKAGPKYLNSPETPLYSKGQVLFNLDKAKTAIREREYAVLVEGQMDCISVYMAGVPNVLATSGTALTEMQVRLLGRFTKNVIVNFDPDAAGASAAEKSIDLFVEEGFTIKVVTLEDGLDPDRYVHERGVEAYIAAIRGARRHADYLIDRARQLFPARTAEAKVKAVNFLLPHIRRSPSRITRDEFAADAAQKLGIDSALMRQELKQAATTRSASIRANAAEAVSETEKRLLRALVLPEENLARQLAATSLSDHPEWAEGLASSLLLEQLALAPVAGNAMDTTTDEATRRLLAGVLMATEANPTAEEVADALHGLERRHLERRQRELRSLITEADRRADAAMLKHLMQEKIDVERQLKLLNEDI